LKLCAKIKIEARYGKGNTTEKKGINDKKNDLKKQSCNIL